MASCLEEDKQYSFNQRVHLAQKELNSFLTTNYVLIGIGIFIIAIILLIVIPSIRFIESIGHYENHLGSITGPPCDIDTPKCVSYFILDKGYANSDDVLRLVLAQLKTIALILGMFAIVIMLALFKWTPKIRKIKSKLIDWENDFLDESFIITFNTNRPEGNTNGEKIFNLSQKVFPELRQSDGKQELWKGTFKGKDDYEFDCYQATNLKKKSNVEFFIAKHFVDNPITLDELQKACTAARKSMRIYLQKNKMKDDSFEIFRFICVGRNYDPQFLEEKTREELMDQLDFEYPIDLILEEKDENYRVLWIDYE